jgi:hypothetical protein
MRIEPLKLSLILISGLLMMLATISAYADKGEILADDVATRADVSVLETEAELFEQIKNGVLLSLAECDHEKACSPNVNSDEIQRILLKLDSRITSLSTRYTKTREQGLDKVLLTYADARKGYAAVLDKLDALSDQDEDLFMKTGGATAGAKSGGGSGNINDLYNDVGDDL